MGWLNRTVNCVSINFLGKSVWVQCFPPRNTSNIVYFSFVFYALYIATVRVRRRRIKRFFFRVGNENRRKSFKHTKKLYMVM